MVDALAPEVLADPINVVVDLVAMAESALDRPAIEAAAITVAGGRVKRRRLAQALLDRPAVLADGRSPAPRVVADLLIALRNAGAVSISPPVCAECGKQLRTLQRRGQDWYCAVCGPRPKPCASCGQERNVATLDRHGQPRCAHCPDEDDRDPVTVLAEVIVAVDPSLAPDTIAAAARRMFARPTKLRNLAWILEETPGLLTGDGARAPIPGVLRLIDELAEVIVAVDPSLAPDTIAAAARRMFARPTKLRNLAWILEETPGLLTGDGARAPIPSVLRLIDELCDAGAQKIIHPACPRCGRTIHLHRRIGGLWLCRNCVAKSRAQPCGRCGAVREAAARDAHGQPLCPHCLISEPANQETCTRCQRRRPVSVRTPDGPLCQNCRPIPMLPCSICGRVVPCEISMTTGRPWCKACGQRWATCASCRQVRPVRGGSLTEPLCGTCVRPDPQFWRSCPTCGDPARIRPGRPCARCAMRRRLYELLTDDLGAIRPELQVLYDNLANYERPATVAHWVGASAAVAVLRELAAGVRPLSHEALDALPAGKPVEHLRAVLVATAALPARDEHMVRLERWIVRTIADRADPDEQHLLRRYAVWHLLRRLRGRTTGTTTTHEQATTVQQHVRAALGLLDGLTARGLTLATAQQGDLEAWLASGQASHRHEVGHFVRWASRHRLTSLELAANRWTGPSRVLDTERRWEQARWLLHDDTVPPDDRVAGLLVLLYAQWPAALSRLTLAHVQASDDTVRLRLGHEPVVLPEPLAGLVQQLVATRRGHAALGDQGSSPWLFPGGQPGRPISAFQLAERLRQLGIYSGQARSAALFQLATDLPAAVLARMLGIHISVAAAWQRAASGDWTVYAAEVSRRRPHGQHVP